MFINIFNLEKYKSCMGKNKKYLYFLIKIHGLMIFLVETVSEIGFGNDSNYKYLSYIFINFK